MTAADALLVESVGRLLAERCPPEAVRRAEEEGWAPEVWDAMAEAGLPWVSVPEEAGGAGGTLADACAVLRLVGRHGAPVPLAETGVLGGWLLASAGLGVPPGPVTVAPGRPEDALELRWAGGGWRVSGALHRVPWARRAERLVVLAPADGEGGGTHGAAAHVASVPVSSADVAPGRNLAGEPRDRVVLDGVALDGTDVAPAPVGVDADALRLRGALARAVLMAGAMERASELATAYAGERVQFGRPIARFQAVQHHLVRIASEAALAAMAAEVATAALAAAAAPQEALFAVAAAKTVAGEAARVVTARAHQVHGAIGMTQEHELQLRTRRLWAWADEFGSEHEWSRRLGEDVAARGADELWPRIATGLRA